MIAGPLSLTVEGGSCSGKAVNASRQNDPGLCGFRPDMTRDFNGIGVVVAAAGDGADFRPALEGQANGGAAGWAKVDKDFFLAAV